jgi:hypothetical protein
MHCVSGAPDTRSAMNRFPFLVCMSLSHLDLLPVLLLTVLVKVPFCVSPAYHALVLCSGDAELPLERESLSRLYFSLKVPCRLAAADDALSGMA